LEIFSRFNHIILTWSWLVFTFLLNGLMGAQTQEEKPIHQLSVHHDNDFPLGIDQYYTAGSFIGYSKALSNSFIFNNTADASLQLDVFVGQLIHTPKDLLSTNLDDFERPYAGYLYTSAAVSQARRSHMWIVSGEFGFAGPLSLVGNIQVEFHKLINRPIPTWVGEIENSIHVNTYGDYVKSFQKKAIFFVDLHSRTAFGTRQIFVEQQATLFFGSRSAINKSSFYNKIDSVPELYGYGGVYYRSVGLNALIQGHPWGDNSPFTLRIENQIVGARLGAVLRRRSNTFQLEYVIQTNETMREERIQYVSAVFKRVF